MSDHVQPSGDSGGEVSYGQMLGRLMLAGILGVSIFNFFRGIEQQRQIDTIRADRVIRDGMKSK